MSKFINIFMGVLALALMVLTIILCGIALLFSVFILATITQNNTNALVGDIAGFVYAVAIISLIIYVNETEWFTTLKKVVFK